MRGWYTGLLMTKTAGGFWFSLPIAVWFFLGKLSRKATEFHDGLAGSLSAREALQLSKLLGHLTNRLN